MVGFVPVPDTTPGAFGCSDENNKVIFYCSNCSCGGYRAQRAVETRNETARQAFVTAFPAASFSLRSVASSCARMGKRLAPWARRALGVVRVQKVISQLALANRHIGQTFSLSLLLTKALVARSNTNTAAGFITNRIAGPSRNSNNTGSRHSHRHPPYKANGFLPVLHQVQPYLDRALAPWISSLLSPSPHMPWLRMRPTAHPAPIYQHLGRSPRPRQ